MDMRRGIRSLLTGVAAAMALTAAAFTAYGESTISSLRITVEDSLEKGTILEPSISVSPSSCQLSDISWSKDVEDWKPGKTVFGYLTITADDGREFESSYKSSKCTVSGADFRSAKSEEDDPSTLQVTIRYTPVVQLGMTEEAGWSDLNKTRASWKKVEYASVYELRLYQDGSLIKTLEVSGTTVDLSSYITSGGDYYYEVRAKGDSASEREYLLTGEYVPSEDVLTVSEEEMGEVDGSWKNYQEGRKYQKADGTYPASQWLMIMGQWYYFNADGYAVTGWFQDPETGSWYYMNEQGEMTISQWLQVNGLWYYFNESGIMVTGWIQFTPGEWYYLNPDGSMAVNTVIDGIYQIGSDGKYIAAS